MTRAPVIWEVVPRNPSEEMGGKTGKEGKKPARACLWRMWPVSLGLSDAGASQRLGHLPTGSGPQWCIYCLFPFLRSWLSKPLWCQRKPGGRGCGRGEGWGGKGRTRELEVTENMAGGYKQSHRAPTSGKTTLRP